MKKGRTAFFPAVCLLVCALLCGCGGGETQTGTDWVALAEAGRLHCALQERLRIDAELAFDPEKTSCEVCAARLRIFDAKQCRAVLMPEALATEQSYSGAGEPLSRNVTTDYYLMENEAGASLGVGGTMLHYERPAYDSLYYAFHPDVNSDLYNADRYSTDRDLAFQSRAAAFAEVKALLKKLNVSISDSYECYSLDKSTLTAEYRYIEMTQDDAHEKTHTFRDDEECYCFLLREVLGALPLTKYSYGNADSGTYVSGTQITVYYGKQGLLMLDISSPYEVTATESTETILSANEAIEKLNGKYKTMVLSRDTKVTKISLAYAAVLKNADANEYALVPAWVFELAQEREDHTERYAVLFHAVTGEELV